MTFGEFWPVYVRAHSRPATRVARLVGTLGGWVLVGAAIAERRWWWVAAAVVLAYGLAWLAAFFGGGDASAPYDSQLNSCRQGQPSTVLFLTAHSRR